MHLKLVSVIKVIYCLCCFFYGILISNGLFQENLMILFSKSTLEKLSYENKDILIILMGDFNIDILKIWHKQQFCQMYIKHTLDKEIFDSDLKNTNWKEILKIERGEMLTILLRLSTKNSMRYLINMHLSKIINPRRKTLKKPLDHYWNT